MHYNGATRADTTQKTVPINMKLVYFYFIFDSERYIVEGGLNSESLIGLPSSSQSITPHADPLTWKIIHEFATDLSLPNAEIRLQAHLGGHLIDANWRPALCAEDNLLEPCITRVQAVSLCKQLAGAVLEYHEAGDIFKFSKQLCHFGAHMQQQDLNNVKQMTFG